MFHPAASVVCNISFLTSSSRTTYRQATQEANLLPREGLTHQQRPLPENVIDTIDAHGHFYGSLHYRKITEQRNHLFCSLTA
jgi:hypothetical protein